jgi:hypothetical protein
MKKEIKITLFDTLTNREFKIKEKYFDGFEWSWSEGNYSCDCNRGAFCKFPFVPCGDARFRIKNCDIKKLIEI